MHASPLFRPAPTPRLPPCAALLAAGLACGPAAAHEPRAGDEAALAPVEVKGQALAGGSAAFTSTRLETGDIRERGVNQVQQLFRQVPGMDIRGLGLTGVADSIVLRGFGGGGHGGDIAFSVDGIPLNEAMSHADGYADLNVIVPLELRTMTVRKGPVSVLYGNFNRAGSVSDADGFATIVPQAGFNRIWAGRRTEVKGEPRYTTLSIEYLLGFDAEPPR